MLAAALPVVGGFGVGGCAYALRLQNDCFVWLRAPVSAPRPRGRCARLRRLALRSVRGAAAVGVRTAAGVLFCTPFTLFFLPAPLDTRLSLCYNHRRTDGVRLDRFHFITKERDLSSPVLLFFLCPARGKTPRPPCFWLGRGRSWGLSCCRAVLCGLVVCRASVAVGFWRGAASVVFLPPPVSRLYPAVSRVETSAARP